MESGERVKNNYFDGYPMKKKQYLIMIVMILGYFFEQLDNQILNFAGPNIMHSMNIATPEWASMQSMFMLGMCAGGVLGGWLSDTYGRKITFLGGMALVTSCQIICGFTHSFSVFTLFRVIEGVGIMAMTCIFVTYLLEITPKEQRGKWEGICAGFGCCSIPLIGILATTVLPTNPEAWRLLFWGGGIIGFIPVIVGIFYMDESPRWLIKQGRVAEAEAVVKDLIHVDVDLSDAYAATLKAAQGKGTITGLGALKEMFTSKYLKRTVVLYLICVAQVVPSMIISGWNNIVLQEIGFAQTSSLIITTIGTIGAPFGYFLGAWIGPKGGRRKAIAGALLVEAVCFIAYVWVATSVTQSIVVLGAMYFSVMLMVNCCIVCCNPYYGESYPTQIRNAATGIISSGGRLTNAAAQGIVPFMMATAGFFGLGAVMSGIVLVGVVTSIFFGWDTGKQALEDVC